MDWSRGTKYVENLNRNCWYLNLVFSIRILILCTQVRFYFLWGFLTIDAIKRPHKHPCRPRFSMSYVSMSWNGRTFRNGVATADPMLSHIFDTPIVFHSDHEQRTILLKMTRSKSILARYAFTSTIELDVFYDCDTHMHLESLLLTAARLEPLDGSHTTIGGAESMPHDAFESRRVAPEEDLSRLAGSWELSNGEE